MNIFGLKFLRTMAMFFLAFFSIFGPSSALAGGATGTTSIIEVPAIKQAFPAGQVKSKPEDCKKFSAFNWQQLAGVALPPSYMSPEDACKDILKTFPDAANAPPYSLPYWWLVHEKFGNCIELFVGDRQLGGAYNELKSGNTLRPNDFLTRSDAAVLFARGLTPLALGVCTVSREELGVAMATLGADTAKQLQDLQGLIVQLQAAGKLPKGWVEELNLRLNARIDQLQKQGDANGQAISLLTPFADLIETFLTTGYVYRPDLSDITKMVFVNLRGKQVVVRIPVITGPQGAQGTQGVRGEVGLQGLAGSNGASGAKGESGSAGTNGINGTSGQKGDTGSAGVAGSQGSTGISGQNGDKGDTGSQGSAGQTGAQGTAGRDGKDGQTVYIPAPTAPAAPVTSTNSNTNTLTVNVYGGVATASPDGKTVDVRMPVVPVAPANNYICSGKVVELGNNLRACIKTSGEVCFFIVNGKQLKVISYIGYGSKYTFLYTLEDGQQATVTGLQGGDYDIQLFLR